ncbi:MAG TPA: hypothetical protein VNT04_01725, partial [Gaiellaceae bacterium]|nr:hypothetical protein [Gaiellaceae bacterium]
GGLYAATLVALLLGAPLALSAPTDQPQPPTIDSKPQSLSTERSPSFAFSDSDLTVVSFECQLDGLAFVPCTSPQSYSNLVDGSHTFEVKALDAALNASDTTSYTWTVDGTPPPAPAVSGPPAQSNSSSANLSFSDTEAGVSFECQLDGDGFSSCSSPKSYSGLIDGSHTFEVKALDAASNASGVGSHTWTVDTTPPPSPAVTGPPVLSNSRSATLSFSDADPTAGFQCRLDGAGFGPCTSPKSYAGLGDGPHTFEVKALDAASNSSNVTSYTWTVDATPPPSPTVAGPQAETNQSTATFTFSDTEPGVSFHCRLDKGPFPSCTSPVTYSDLAVGPHTFLVKATDAAGNDSDVASYAWTIDTSPPPVPTIDSRPANPSASSSAQFTFSDAEGGVGYQCRLDAGVFSTCSSPTSYLSLAEGGHSFAVRAVDAAGNPSGSALYSWLVDTVPPITTIGDKPPLSTDQTGASFTFTSDTPGSTFQCSLDGAGFAACTSPKSYSGLANGSHTFRVKALDAAANEGQVASYTWTVDTAGPPAPLLNGPPNPSGSDDATFTFSDSEAGVAFECRLDGAAFAACTSPKSYSGLADGSHTFRVRAVDGLSNPGAATVHTWTVDTTGPPAPSVLGPLTLTKLTTATFTFSDSEPGVTFQCRLDAAAFAPCTSPKSYSGLADGPHTFRVKALDALSNESGLASYAWTIDTTTPPAPSASGPPDPSGSDDPTFTFSDSEAGVTFECRLDGGNFAPCSSPQGYTSLADGSHTFRVRAVDAATNASAATLVTWTIDTTGPPAPSLGGPPALTNSTIANFTFSDNEAGVTFQCRLDAAAFAPCSSPKSYSSLADGSHTFRVKALDALSNESQVASQTWTIDTAPPPAPLVTGPDNPSGTGTATFTFSDAELGVTFKCQLNGGGFAPCVSPKPYTLADGTHTFEVEAVDPAGNASTAASHTWLIDTVNPVVTLTDKPASLTNRTSASFSLKSNKAGSTFECRLDNAIFASCLATKVFTGLGDGSHTFAARATFLGNTGPATLFSWKIDTLAPATTITSGPTGTTTSVSASFAFASSEAASRFLCSLDSAGFTPCTSAKTYDGLGDGPHTFRVQAVDLAGNADASPATSTWTINHPGPETVDHTPPGDIRSLARTVGYGVLKLSWVKPTDPDFDHVGVFLSTNAKRSARAMVYQGGASSYTVKRFKNGLYYSYAIVTYDRAGNASRGVATVVPASILLRSPRDGAGVRTPPRLVWSRVPKASFYNVQLYRGSQKIFSAWPRVAKLTLGRSWAYAGHRYQLKRGTYRWYVWPAFGPRSKARYGQLLGQSTFKFR